MPIAVVRTDTEDLLRVKQGRLDSDNRRDSNIVCGKRLVTAQQRRGAPLVLAMVIFGLLGCAHSASPTSSEMTVAASRTAVATFMDETTAPDTTTKPVGAQPKLSSDPVQLADDLVADEQALRDPSTSEAALEAAARRQQAAYRAIGRHSEWDAIIRPRIPPSLLESYDLNVGARRQLTQWRR